jgi:NitT/TauT family transport system substrate-binding protein
MRLPQARLVDAARALALIAAVTASGVAGAQETADTPLRVGVLPIADVAPLYLGLDKGFFKQEHLAIQPVPAFSGAVTLTAVASGDNQIGYGNVVSLILANAHGIPIEAIANGSQTFGDAKHQAGVLVVAGNSRIHTLADLDGKTIGVNQINGMNDLVIKSMLSRRGVDASKVKFIELPPTTAAGALKDGRVDAIMTTDPFLAQAESDGDRPILRPLDEFATRLTLGVYYASRAFVDANPATIARFQRAMWRSLAYAQKHPDEARRMIPFYTRMNAHDAASYDLVSWDTSINLASIEQLEHAMVTFGLLTQDVDVSQVFLPSAVRGR